MNGVYIERRLSEREIVREKKEYVDRIGGSDGRKKFNSTTLVFVQLSLYKIMKSRKLM